MIIEREVKQIEVIEKLGDRPNINNFKESMDFKLKHNTVKSRVLSILRQDKYARKDDFYLCLLYWVKSGHIKLIVPLEDFSKINKPETISRCRRELISDAKKGIKELQFLLKDNETMELRQDYENKYHDYYQDKHIEEQAVNIK